MSQEELKNRVKAQLKHYAPEKAAQADTLLGKYAGKEKQLLDALVKQYGPEPAGGATAAAAGGGDLKERVKAQLKHYAPEKAAQADTLLGKYVGKEKQLLDALVKQYGPEPSGGAAAASTTPAAAAPKTGTPTPAAASGGGGNSGDLKARVKVQLQHYAPEKAAQADALLGKYVGKEKQLLDALVKQYGPEPSPSTSSSGCLNSSGILNAGNKTSLAKSKGSILSTTS